MMTTLAIKEGARVNAAAIISGVLDLFDSIVRRPEMEAGVFAPLIPDFAARRAEALRERSAVFWPERITAPLLLLHGTNDWRVYAGQSLALAAKLQALGQPYQLHIYANDGHGLPENWRDRDARIIAWFREHLRQ
jgi:dipeptidyl aminopeptidase/acylaminoacyl peptidase